jgi:hypothetical protein
MKMKWMVPRYSRNRMAHYYGTLLSPNLAQSLCNYHPISVDLLLPESSAKTLCKRCIKSKAAMVGGARHEDIL